MEKIGTMKQNLINIDLVIIDFRYNSVTNYTYYKG